MFRYRGLTKFRRNVTKSLPHSILQQNYFGSSFSENKVMISPVQKMILLVGSTLQLFLVDHKRLDLLACVAELTSNGILSQILTEMWAHCEGEQILFDRPVINAETVRLDILKSLPKNTLGHEYVKFLYKYGITSNDRLDVKFMENPDLAYVMTRYRQSHDLVHTLLNVPLNKIGEVCIKWVEAFSVRIPLCYAAAILGPLLMNEMQRTLYKKYYLPWTIKTCQNLSFPLLFIYWEKRWEQNITDLRNELGIMPFNKNIIKKGYL